MPKDELEIIKLCEAEDSEIRKAQVRLWKKYEEFWHGVQYLFWSSKDNDWRSPLDISWGDFDENDDIKEQIGSFYDYVIDVFKAHGESLISALAAQLPGIRFMPDDADNAADVLTARTYSKIADLICRHNKAKLVFYRALFFLYINGIVASYRYKESDEKYGTYKIPIYGKQTVESSTFVCPDCESTNPVPSAVCPQCGSITPQKEVKNTEEVPTIESYKILPKTRVKVEVYGPLFFKVPYYATSQKECGYLIHYLEVSKSSAMFNYPDFVEDIEKEYIDNSDRFSRTEFTYPADPEVEQKNLVTIIKAWLRPSEFYKEKVS
jgi:hypothetical protein